MSRANYALSIAVVLALLAPAIWNGYPILQYDTGGYLARWYEGYLVPSRSTAYGIYLHLGETSHFIFNLVLQAVAVVWIVRATLRALGIVNVGHIALVFGCLCAATALPILTSMLLTDVFAGLAVLSLLLLVAYRTRFSGIEQFIMFLFTSFAISTHSATLGVLLGLCCSGWALHTVLPERLPKAGLALGSLTVIAGSMILVVSNWALSGHLAWTPGGPSILFGRMLQDGLVERYLDDHCPSEHLKLCAYKEVLPNTADEFLWARNSVFNYLGRFDGLGDEMAHIAWRSTVSYPAAQAAAAGRATAKQLFSVATGEGANTRLPHTYGIFEHYLSPELPSLRAARQQHGELDFRVMNDLHIPIAWLSILSTCAIFVYGLLIRLDDLKNHFDDELTFLTGTVTIALIGNAFLCGVISGPHDRYGARMTWIATFACAVAAVRWLLAGKRQPKQLIASEAATIA